MLSMTFLAGRCEFVAGREFLAVYAPAICGSHLFMLMAGTAFNQRQAVLVRQLCVTLYAADVMRAVDRFGETFAIDFNGARSSLPDHFRILLGPVAAKTNLFTPLPGKPQIPWRLLPIPWILSGVLPLVLREQAA
jgi:hypothetical protein